MKSSRLACHRNPTKYTSSAIGYQISYPSDVATALIPASTVVIRFSYGPDAGVATVAGLADVPFVDVSESKAAGTLDVGLLFLVEWLERDLVR